MEKKSLLLVEDEAIIAINEKQQLEDYGYTVQIVYTGEDAVRYVCDNKEGVDLILMDIDLGSGIDGTEAAEKILQQRNIPILFLSSHTNPDVVQKTEKITSYGYVVKASSITVLDASIKMAFKLFRAEEESLKFKTISDKAVYGHAIADLQGYLLYTNAYYAEVHGYAREKLIGKNLSVFHSEKQMPVVRNLINELKTYGHFQVQEQWHVHKNGKEFPMMMSGVMINDSSGQPAYLAASAIDISEIVEARLIDAAAMGLSEFSYYADTNEILQRFLDTAEELTNSSIGFFHFLDENEEILLLQAWSSNTRNKMCSARTTVRHYPVVSAGIWADCVRQRTPILHNDYAALPHKKEMPEGHAEVLRELTVPVIRNTKVRAVFGVGNKAENYNERDVAIVQRFADMAWDIVERKQAVDALTNQNLLFSTLVDNMQVGIFMVDAPNGKPLLVNEKAKELLGRDIVETANKQNLAEVYAAYRETLTTPYPVDEMPIALGLKGVSSHIDDMLVLRPDGTKTFLEVYGSPVENVHGEIYASLVTFFDITQRIELEKVMADQISQKEILLKEIHHRVKNNITSIEGLIALHIRSTENHEAKGVLQEAVSRIQSLRVLYDNLLIKDDYKEISIKTYMEKLINSIHAVYLADKNIEVEKSIEDFSIDVKKAIPLGIITNELMTNIFKYAFFQRDKGFINIRITKKDTQVELFIHDDGIGFDERKSNASSTGLGLTIVKMLVDQLGGTFSVKQKRGTTSLLNFPL